jgi:hypothetical protein
MEGIASMLLLSLAYTLPALLASVAALAWLAQKAPAHAPGRRQAMLGAGLVLGTCLLQAALAGVRTWVVSGYETGGGSLALLQLLNPAGFILALGSAAGVALLGWGAAQAMSGYRDAS